MIRKNGSGNRLSCTLTITSPTQASASGASDCVNPKTNRIKPPGMNTVGSEKTQCSLSTGSVLPRTGTRTEMVDLLGVRIREQKRKKGKGLGCLPKKELIVEVRKIFPNATVLPNE